MEPLTAPCPDSPKALLARELCLSEVSKNLEGELRLLESEREDCKTPKCRTLKTMHLLELEVKSHRPCDSRPGRLLDGALTVHDLVHAFARGDGNRRGVRAGSFRWRGAKRSRHGWHLRHRQRGHAPQAGLRRLPALRRARLHGGALLRDGCEGEGA